MINVMFLLPLTLVDFFHSSPTLGAIVTLSLFASARLLRGDPRRASRQAPPEGDFGVAGLPWAIRIA
jgi:hypothetical protein